MSSDLEDDGKIKNIWNKIMQGDVNLLVSVRQLDHVVSEIC